MADVLADRLLDDDGDVLLGDLLDDLDVDPVVGGQEGVVVPELECDSIKKLACGLAVKWLKNHF